MAQLTLAETVVRGNKPEAIKFVTDYGYRASNNDRDLILTINQILLKHGESAADDLLKIHPDREEILATMVSQEKPASWSNCCGHMSADGNNTNSRISPNGRFHNCTGCGGGCGGGNMNFSNADGNSTTNTHPTFAVDLISQKMFYTVVLVIGVFGIIALVNSDKRRAGV